MRLEAATLPKETHQEDQKIKIFKESDTEAEKVEERKEEEVSSSQRMEEEDSPLGAAPGPGPSHPMDPAPGPNPSHPMDTASSPMEQEPDSSPSIQPLVCPVPPHGAIVFRLEDGASLQYDTDVGDDFFELSINEVKSRQKELQSEVKRLAEGEAIMTKEMREAQKEGQKLALINKYKTGVLRIQLPDRHIVQGEFPPSSTPTSILKWVAPLLAQPPDPKAYLYTAPPHHKLDGDCSLLDLGLYPAALIHYSTPQTTHQHLTDLVMDSLSNSAGAQQAARDARRQALRVNRGGGIGGASSSNSGASSRCLEQQQGGTQGHQGLRPGQVASDSKASSGQKVPKWFKTGK